MPAANLSNETYRALADPTRRALLELLAKGERAAGDLVRSFQISQPAVSQQLKTLRDAGLVCVRRDGRRRLYSLRAQPLADVHAWVAHFEKLWDEKLESLGRHLDTQARKKT